MGFAETGHAGRRRDPRRRRRQWPHARRPLVSSGRRTSRPPSAPAIRALDRSDTATSRRCAASTSTCESGEIFGLIGPDGAGKTSTFQILGGVMEGQRRGRRAARPAGARHVASTYGYLTQAFSLYPDLSVAENIPLYRRPATGAGARDRRGAGSAISTMFGMERFTDRLAGRLSGGMKQKLALACALRARAARAAPRRADDRRRSRCPRREFWDALAPSLSIARASPSSLAHARISTRRALPSRARSCTRGVSISIGHAGRAARQPGPGAPRGARGRTCAGRQTTLAGARREIARRAALRRPAST